MILDVKFHIKAFNGDPESRIAVNLWVGDTRYDGIPELLPGCIGSEVIEFDSSHLNYKWGNVLRASIAYLDKWGGSTLIGGRWDLDTWVSVTLHFKVEDGNGVKVELLSHAKMADSRTLRFLIQMNGDVELFPEDQSKVYRIREKDYLFDDGWLTLQLQNVRSIKSLRLPAGLRFEYLSLIENQITKIDGLEYSTSKYLYELWLNNNQISHIEGLDFCPHLKMIDLRVNKISKIAGLEYCTELEILLLEDNQITKIEGLENCTHLKRLYLRNNQITKIEGLENCTELEILYLDKNPIKDFRGLECLPTLKKLSLTNIYFSPEKLALLKKTFKGELSLSWRGYQEG